MLLVISLGSLGVWYTDASEWSCDVIWFVFGSTKEDEVFLSCNETYLNYWRYCLGWFCFIIILFDYSESYVISLLCPLLLLNIVFCIPFFFSFYGRLCGNFYDFFIMVRLRRIWTSYAPLNLGYTFHPGSIVNATIKPEMMKLLVVFRIKTGGAASICCRIIELIIIFYVKY
jgi:hypothetical protein